MVEAYISLVDNLLGSLLRQVAKSFGVIRIGPFVVELRSPTKANYADTLRKIAAAQEHLGSATESIDAMKSEFSTEKQRLDKLLKEITEKRSEYEAAAAELDTARELLGKDRGQLRSVLGLDERRGRISGFVAGVVASLLATALWTQGPALLRLVQGALGS